MADGHISYEDFTDNALDSFYGTVDDPYFRDRDLNLIYEALKNELRLVPFGDHLKRYIYRKAALTGDYREIPVADYQAILRDAFADTGTPASFTPTTARSSALMKNWLTQQSVKRNVVLLLGFGLEMSVADVNEFMTKALREQMLNPKDPLETLCWYCYRNRYPFSRFEALWEEYEAMPVDDAPADDLLNEQTTGVRAVVLRHFGSDGDVLAYLRRLRLPYDGGPRQSVAARAAFDSLYARSREIAAKLINEADADDAAVRARRLREKLDMSDRLYEYEKAERVRRSLGSVRPAMTAEDVTPGDVERIICSAVPVGDKGALLPAKASRLSQQFSGKRFSRQHVGEVLAGRAGIDRFDLITLNFFNFAGDIENHPHARRRYSSFIDQTNRILDRCAMGPLYVANPYECFVLMCLLSEDPLGTYADVLELSYQPEENS